MATLNQIDRTKELSFCGYRTVKLTDPEMVALAARMSLPQMLCSDDPVDEGIKVGPDDATTLLDRMAEQEWRSQFETDLQCVCEDMEGRPFLTTWVSLDVFRRFAESVADLRVRSCLTTALREWQHLGAMRIYVEGYRLI